MIQLYMLMIFTNLSNTFQAWMHPSTYPETMKTGHRKYMKMFSKERNRLPLCKGNHRRLTRTPMDISRELRLHVICRNHQTHYLLMSKGIMEVKKQMLISRKALVITLEHSRQGQPFKAPNPQSLVEKGNTF